MMALPSPTSGTSVFLLWPISSGEMSSWMTFMSLAKRGARPKWKIQLNRAPIRKTTSACCSASVRAAATDSGWSSGTTPLPIGERRNGSCVRSMKERTSSSARAQAMPLPTRTSGRCGLFEQVQRGLDVLCRRHHARRLGHALDLDDFVEVAFAGDDVVGHVEIAGAGAAIDRLPSCHLDIVGDALRRSRCRARTCRTARRSAPGALPGRRPCRRDRSPRRRRSGSSASNSAGHWRGRRDRAPRPGRSRRRRRRGGRS